MSTNPIQKKVRNSFLLGMIITLIVCIAVGVIIWFVISDKNKKKEEEEAKNKVETVVAYVLNQDVQSGQTVTADLLKQIEVPKNTIPSNYVYADLLNAMQLQDENGNILYTNKDGILYINSENSSRYHMVSDGKVEIDMDQDGYYKTKINGEKEYIKLLNVPTVAKVNLNKNTVLTTSLITESDQLVTDNLRYMEYNMITMPTTLDVGGYVDIRLRLSNGQDYIVLSKKEIVNIFGQTIGLNLTEEEILLLNSAMVESYIMPASQLYMAEYIEVGLQTASTSTYIPTYEVINLINTNENIVSEVRSYLVQRYNSNTTIRDTIEANKSQYASDANYNLEAGIQEQIQAARKARENYLSGLEGY